MISRKRSKFEVGDRVKLSIPRDDVFYKFDEKVGIITQVIGSYMLVCVEDGGWSVVCKRGNLELVK